MIRESLFCMLVVFLDFVFFLKINGLSLTSLQCSVLHIEQRKKQSESERERAINVTPREDRKMK